MLATMPQKARVLRDHQRTRLQPVNDESAEQQRHYHVRRNAQRHQRNEGAARRGVVGGFGSRHALDRALAEALRRFG
jgi:hypothetical protein